MSPEKLKAIKENNFTVAGVLYTYETFKEQYGEGSDETAETVLEVLERKGVLKIMDLKTKEQQLFENIGKEEAVREAAEMFIIEEEMQKDYNAQVKREGKLTYPGIELEFAKVTDASRFMQYCMQDLRIKEVSMVPGIGVQKVQVRNITDDEYKAISKYYTAMNVTNIVQRTATNTMKKATNSVDFAAKNVVAPVAEIGVKSVSSLFKTAATLGTRIGATTITAVASSAKQTREEIATDPEVIKAAATIIDAKDSLIRSLNKKTGMKKGISFLQS